jgi:hypothetical protein
VAVTEKRTEEEMNQLVRILGNLRETQSARPA